MHLLKQSWWKFLCVVLIAYTIIAGFLIPSPDLPILHESIRNLYFHVPMWFGMTLLLFISLYYSIRYLRNNSIKYDVYSSSCAGIGLLFGTMGILTGMQWAKTTWGAWWVNDPKLLGAAVGMLIYLAYFVLRSSIDDIDRRAKVAAVFNVMSFSIFIPVIFIVPRLTDSLHPGNGGNPGFSAYDLDGDMRLVFYPAVIGWTLLGVWLMTLWSRLRLMELEMLAGSDMFNYTKIKSEEQASFNS
ncbi:MAG: cytochrome c biogenesis protein CcsA [Chitinophagales bacterium]|nr:cytochrome c biogenesis protein CcsA [Chitinophagales bacterium]